MAYKHREEIVGKRFLCVNSASKGKLSKPSDLDWRAGIIRAASHKDPKHPELSVLVEFDNADWERREWIHVYEDRFAAFLVEETLTWHVRSPDESPSPALNFNSFIDRVGVWDQLLKPLEYLTDRFLRFVDYAELRFYQERDVDVEPCCQEQGEVRRLVKRWVEFQDSQRILLTTPSVLVGYRVKVYRAQGTTQWYTACIVSYNDSTRQLTVTDDTVLEAHNVDPCLVQMRLIGDGVVESILKGENVGITPRRRTCTLNSPLKVSHGTARTRHIVSSQAGGSSAASLASSSPRRSRTKPDHEPTAQEDAKGDKRRRARKCAREEELPKKSSPLPLPPSAIGPSTEAGVPEAVSASGPHVVDDVRRAAPADCPPPAHEVAPGVGPPATMRSSAGPVKSEASARDAYPPGAHLEQPPHTRLMQQQQPPQQGPPLYPPRPGVQPAARPLVYGLQSSSGVLPGPHVDPLSSPLAYQQLLMGQNQYVDMLWNQKMAGLPPPAQATAWAMAMEARASQERHSMLERERREEEEKREREKSEMLEREKAEKERQERHKKEEQERVQREAVQQHFEESLRLASQKTYGRMMSVAQNPHQNHLDSPKAGCIRAGWSPIASLPYPKAPAASTSSSSVITQPEKQREKQELDHHEKYSMEARMRQVADQERWLSMVQQQQQQQHQQQQQQQRLELQAQAPAHHRISHAEQLKPKLDIHARSSPKTNQMLPGSNLSQKVGSSVPSTSSVTVATSKGEPSFNLYGYQPFPQMYITQAQLKAREESKSHHSQPIVNRQPLVSSPSHLPRIEKDLRFDRSSTPGGQRGSPKPPVKDRVSPAMSTPGTFRPYEYNSAGPAPAHQGSLARCPTSFPQEEAQNLVKCSRSRQDSPLSTPSPGTTSYSCSGSSSQPAKATQPYSYSLIQQGLVPNPLYTPATPTTQGSKLVPPGVLQSSPVGPAQGPAQGLAQGPAQGSAQQYLRAMPGITTGTPVCRPGQEPKLSYGPARPVPRSRSPSMHLQTASSTPPRLTPPSPQPLNLQQGALSPGRRKAAPELPLKLPKREESQSPVQCLPVAAATPPTAAPENVSPLATPPAASPVPLVATTQPQQEASFRPFAAATAAAATTTTPQVPSSSQPPQQQSPGTDSYQAFYKKGRPKARPPNAPSPASGEDSKPGSLGGGSSIVHESDSDTRVTPSPAPSTCTTISNSSSNHTKLKKAWLQRHSEIEDKRPTDAEARLETSSACASPAKQESAAASKVCVNGHDTEASGSIRDDCSSSSASEAEKPTVSRKTRVSRKRGASGRDKSGSKRQRGNSESNSDVPPEESSPKKEEKPEMIARRRGRRPKGLKHHEPADEAPAVPRKKQGRSAEKQAEARLKKSGLSYLQDCPCFDVSPKLPKCRECRMTPNQRNKKMPNIFCRFFAFRKLRYNKTGTVVTAGFSEPGDAVQDDLKLWMPLKDHPPKDLDVATAKIILAHVGDQFCDLVQQEREARSLHIGENPTIAWKRVVQGVREMCDVCETTLFNIHWVCHKCGFVVCIDCYKAKKNGTVKAEEPPSKDRDEFQWLMCANRVAHEQKKLMITQIIAGTALWDVCNELHMTRTQWNIPGYCGCSAQGPDKNVSSPNGICKQLMSSVDNSFSAEKECSAAVNGEASSSSPPKRAKRAVNGNASSEDEDSGGSPLSVLADVALHSSSKMDEEEQSEGNSEERGEDFSTLRELLIRPSGAGGAKKMVMDELVAVVAQQAMGGQGGQHGEEREQQLVHFCRRAPPMRRGREALPERFYSHGESSDLYPGAPHSWLCGGKLLVLHEPRNKNNLALFQEQWKRGQPVLVTDVCKNLNMSLWHPDGFCRDFGEIRNDLVNCRTGNILINQPMRKFWEGFENFSKRMKDEDGEYMLLKLKDWPPGDDFSDMLPTRFSDLMKVLPLPEYTHRDGVFNLAGRLPDCFVRPDLGPKMYNAYGSALYPNKGTTNLHLDVSDAVNVMVYVGIPKDGKDEEHINAALRAIDEGSCDALTRKRVREQNAKPGALWHIYNARDADKIRDLLNKVAEERGEKLEPHHDPIHDQSWYLDEELRKRLYDEYKVEGYAIAQCLGEAVFIPAGAPHQVRNLHSCIKVAEDFVSPENIAHCFSLTNEFRQLSDTHTNHEDKLQIKNVIYHAVKDALITLNASNK